MLTQATGVKHVVQFTTGTSNSEPYSVPDSIGTTVNTYSSTDWPNITFNRYRSVSVGAVRRFIFNRSGSDSWNNNWIDDSDFDDTSLYVVNHSEKSYFKFTQGQMTAGGGFMRRDVNETEAIEYPTSKNIATFVNEAVSNKNMIFFIGPSDLEITDSS